MGLLSSMINSGSIKVEVDTPSNETIEIGFPTAFAVKVNTEETIIDVYDKKYCNNQDWIQVFDLSGTDELYISTMTRFISIWSKWLNNIIMCRIKGNTDDEVLAKAEQLFWKKAMEILVDYSPLRKSFTGVSIDPNLIVTFKILPPPIEDMIPDYVGNNPLLRIQEETLRTGQIQVLAV